MGNVYGVTRYTYMFEDISSYIKLLVVLIVLQILLGRKQ